jgi:hypothetical protein
MSCSFCDGVEMRWKYVKTRRMYFLFSEKHSNTSIALQSELIIFKCHYTLQSACWDVVRLISIPRLMSYNICTGLLETVRMLRKWQRENSALVAWQNTTPWNNIMVKTLTLLLRIPKVPGSILARQPTILTEFFVVFSSSCRHFLG